MTSKADPITRQALYVRVWTTPITELAKEFGLSGTAFVATCRRHGIPTPRPGYWMKKEFGKPVEQPPLEDFDGMSAGTTVVMAATTKTPKPTPPAKTPPGPPAGPSSATNPPKQNLEAVDSEKEADQEADLHPILDLTRKKLLSPSPAGGFAKAEGKGAFFVSVSPQYVTRALHLLNRLVGAVEAQGWSVTRSEKGLQLRPDGEDVGFTLIEQTDRVRHKITDAEREAQSRFELKRAAAARRGDWFGAGSPPQIPDWDFRPTGCLVLQLNPNPMAFGAASGLRRTFSETRSRGLDSQIDRIVEALAARAAAAKEIRRIRAEREAKWAEEEARRKEAERRQRLEIKRQEFLERQLERHTAARQLESFLARYDPAELQDNPEAVTFMNWARGRLDRLEADLSPEAIGQRFGKAELVSDDADVPSWRKVE